MRRYETIVIIDPDLSEEDRTSFLTRVKEIIPQQGGVLIQEDLWGVKKLAYEIKKKPRGYYVRMDYCGLGKAVDEIERFFRIDDRAMKFLTVQLSAEADVEKIQADIAAAKASVTQETTATESVTPASAIPVPEAPIEEQRESAQDTDADANTPES
ncbi:MAG: 30S ribosomal protein S6 [Desulfobacterales bacterium]|nr:30S ribosomal protein S6 [Desulfobacterales bacterium]